MAQAFAILSQLGSPDRETAGRTLARLREKMGQAAFEAALTDAGAAPPPGGDNARQGMVKDSIKTVDGAAKQIIGVG